MKSLLAIVGFASLAAYGSEPANAKACVALRENSKRLACYDLAMEAESSVPVSALGALSAESPIPLEIKSMTIGMPFEQVKAKFSGKECRPTYCFHSRDVLNEGELDSFGGKPVTEFSGSFDGEKLTGLVLKMTLSTNGIVSLLTTKYGSPVRTEKSYKTNTGANGIFTSWIWSHGDVQLKFASSDVGPTSEAAYLTLSSKSADKKAQEQKDKKAAKDL
jgi:hypothetical protein